MYSSIEVSRYLGIQHKQLLKWCDDYYEEFGLDENYITDIQPKKYKNGSKYYLIGEREINGFGSMMNNKRGLHFLEDLKDGYFFCDIDDFLNIDTNLKKAIREHITNFRLEEGYMNDGRYFQHYTDLIYSVLGIEYPKGVKVRDILDKRMLVRLEDLEDRVSLLIAKYANDGVHYKEAFQIIKKEISK